MTCAFVLANDYRAYLPTRVYNTSEFDLGLSFYNTPIEEVRDSLLKCGTNADVANILARGVCIRQASKTSDIFYIYFAEELPFYKINNVKPYFYLYAGDCSFLREMFGD